MSTEALLQVCKYEGSWLEIYDLHFVAPLSRAWNKLQQELYTILYTSFFSWRGLAYWRLEQERSIFEALEFGNIVLDENDL